ncbi:MAG: hypothetical protein U0841_10855 [Chloroflexia bacterium]
MLQQSISRPTLAGNADSRVYKYFDLIMAAFVAVLLINVTVVKVMRLGPFHLGPITLGLGHRRRPSSSRSATSSATC